MTVKDMWKDVRESFLKKTKNDLGRIGEILYFEGFDGEHHHDFIRLAILLSYYSLGKNIQKKADIQNRVAEIYSLGSSQAVSQSDYNTVLDDLIFRGLLKQEKPKGQSWVLNGIAFNLLTEGKPKTTVDYRIEFNKWKLSKEGKEWKTKQWIKQNGMCYGPLCNPLNGMQYGIYGTRYNKGSMHIDHIKSIKECVSKNVNPNTIDNYQLLCSACNQSKGS